MGSKSAAAAVLAHEHPDSLSAADGYVLACLKAPATGTVTMILAREQLLTRYRMLQLGGCLALLHPYTALACSALVCGQPAACVPSQRRQQRPKGFFKLACNPLTQDEENGAGAAEGGSRGQPGQGGEAAAQKVSCSFHPD